MSLSLTAVLQAAARVSPDAPFVRREDGSLTFSGLEDRTGRVAAGLLTDGVTPGARVDLDTEEAGDFIIGALGALRIGVVVSLARGDRRMAVRSGEPCKPVLAPAEEAVWSQTAAVVDADGRVHTHGNMILDAQAAGPAQARCADATNRGCLLRAAVIALVNRVELVI